MFWCPGCDGAHLVYVGSGSGPRWGYNDNPERPTFTPSVLVKSGHYISTHKPGDPCWCDYEARFGRPSPFKCSICHSFVTDGKIQFLPDCTHELAGKTVDLPDWEDG
jgi:hypothetical protein